MMVKANKTLKIFTFLPIFATLLTSCKTYTRTDVEQYQTDLREYREKSDFHSQLYIFPDSVKGEVVKYIVSEREDLFNGSYFIYLVLNLDKETFNEELDRLSEIKATYTKYDNKVKPILYYPEESIYLSVMRDNRYEYALYNKETLQIGYVSNQLYQWKEVPLLTGHELPSLIIPSEYDDGDNSYNLYYLYENNVGHEISD